MRKAILLVAALAACHPPSLKDRAVHLGAKFSALGSKTVAIVSPHVSVDVRAAVTSELENQARARIAAAVPVPQPIVVHRSVVHEQSVAAAPAPAPMPAMTVTHVDAAEKTFFGLRDGNSCTRYDTIEACNSACTALSQQRGMSGQPNANCSCLEDAPGC